MWGKMTLDSRHVLSTLPTALSCNDRDRYRGKARQTTHHSQAKGQPNERCIEEASCPLDSP